MAGFSAGEMLGPYILVDRIAVGGMAELYLAKTCGVAGFEKLLCLKVIHPNYADDDHFIEMLIDEAKIAVGLNQANIAQIFDLGREGQTYFIAMEYVDGADLFRVMRSLSESEIDVPIDVAAFIALEICTGLDYAHRKRDEAGRPLGIIHRDISPQNILISHSGEVKIVDFGIAKAASRTRTTQAGVIKGKYYYMSPEQAWGDGVDHRTDIFSCGVVLYEVLVGQMLYLEEDMQQLLDMVRRADIPRPSLQRPEIPPQLEIVVMKALAKRPTDRWQTAHELQVALTNFLFSYAPDFTPARLARLVDRALAGRRRPGELENGPPGAAAESECPASQPSDDRFMSRLDFRPETGHSVLFHVSDYLPPAALEDEDGGEKTQISVSPIIATEVHASDGEVTRAELLAGWPDEPAENEEHDPTWVSPMRQSSAPGGVRGVTRGRNTQQRADDPPVEVIVQAPLLGRPAFGGGVSPPSELTPTPALELAHPTSGAAGAAQAAGPAGQPPGPAKLPAAAGRSSPPPLPPEALGQPRPAGASPAASRAAGGAGPPRALAESSPQRPGTVAAPAPAVGFADSDNPSGAAAVAVAAASISTAPRKLGTTSLVLDAAGCVAQARNTPSITSPSRLASDAQYFARAAPNLRGAVLRAAETTEEAAFAPRRRWRRRRLLVLGAMAMAAVAGIGAAAYLLGWSLSEAGGTIEVISVPVGASAAIEGKPAAGVTPVVIPVAGTRQPYTIVINLSNYQLWKQTVSFAAGETRLRVLAVLTAIYGKLVVRSSPPGADVYVNSEHRGKTPITVENLLPTEDVHLELRRRGYRPATQVLKWEGRTHFVTDVTLRRSR